MPAIEIRHEVTPRLPPTWHRVLAIGCGDCLAVGPAIESVTSRADVWAYLITMPGASRAITVSSRSGIPPDAGLHLALDDATDVGDARSGGRPPPDPLLWFDGVVDIHHTNCAAHGLSQGHVPLEEQLQLITHSQAAAWPRLTAFFPQLPIEQRIFNVTTKRWLFGRED